MQTADQEREWWEQTATDEDIWNGPGDGLDQLEQLIPAIKPALEGPGRVVMELGCGNGRLLVPMAEAFPLATFMGVDIAFRPFPRPRNAGLLGTDGRTILMGDGMIDAAYSVLLFQHLPEEAVRGYLAELARVLRPGGLCCIQFVARLNDDTAPDGFLDYRYLSTSMLDWALDAGFDSGQLACARIQPEWDWLTCWKEPSE